MMLAILAVAAMALLLWVTAAPAVRPYRLLSPPARAGHSRIPTTLDVAQLLERLAAVLGTGAAPRQAWTIVAEAQPNGELASLARAVAAGARPTRAAGGGLAEQNSIRTLGAALEVCERSGAPLAGVLHALAGALRDLHDADLARRSAFAGPRSTARILLALPLLGIGLGMLLGADPLATLTETGPGRILLVAGALLTFLGWWWMRQLMHAAEQGGTTGVDPSVLLELVAEALGAGLPLAEACRSVGDALPDEEFGEALRRYATSARAGVPAQVSARELPTELAALGESAVLAERSGADLARILRGGAQDARRSRARDAEMAAARLGVRLVLPTGVTLLPAFVVLGIIPTIASLLGGSLTDGSLLSAPLPGGVV